MLFAVKVVIMFVCPSCLHDRFQSIQSVITFWCDGLHVSLIKIYKLQNAFMLSILGMQDLQNYEAGNASSMMTLISGFGQMPHLLVKAHFRLDICMHLRKLHLYRKLTQYSHAYSIIYHLSTVREFLCGRKNLTAERELVWLSENK